MMSQQKFLDRYSGQTVSELLAFEGIYRTDSLILAFEQGLDQKSFKHGESTLSPTERMILAIEALEREVNNGGYDQFFRNSSVEYVLMVVASLEAIGCPNTANITQDAITALGLSPTPATTEIEKVMAMVDESRDVTLSKCDSRYYASGEDIASVLFAYIKAHRGDIGLP